MRHLILSFIFCLFAAPVSAQIDIITTDITHFWQAYDSVRSTSVREKQIDFVQRLYLDKGSFGIEYTLDFQSANAENWVDMIAQQQQRLEEIRPLTLSVLEQKATLERKIERFKQLYPNFKSGNVYMIIGTGVFGGRVSGTNLIIGTEVVAENRPNWAVPIVLHEFVHTQQTMSDDALLSHSILEGMADFVAELVNEEDLAQTYPGGYIDFGNKNEKAVWKAFKKYMYSDAKGKFYLWMYDRKGFPINGEHMRDLGYFMGYKICKSYYAQAPDKTLALREMLEMDYSNNENARQFLLKSGYVPAKDLKYVQTMTFGPLPPPKNQKVLGYQLKGSDVVFRFKVPEEQNMAQIEQVIVTGSFNEWNPKNDNWKMTHTKRRSYELRVPKSKLGAGYHEFKFVVNGTNWHSAPENARNVDQSGYRNYTLMIK